MLFRVILSALVIFIGFQTATVFADSDQQGLIDLIKRASKVDDKEVQSKLDAMIDACELGRDNQEHQESGFSLAQIGDTSLTDAGVLGFCYL